MIGKAAKAKAKAKAALETASKTPRKRNAAPAAPTKGKAKGSKGKAPAKRTPRTTDFSGPETRRSTTADVHITEANSGFRRRGYRIDVRSLESAIKDAVGKTDKLIVKQHRTRKTASFLPCPTGKELESLIARHEERGTYRVFFIAVPRSAEQITNPDFASRAKEYNT